MKPTVVSFFAGMGGFDLAFERAGFKVILQVELDPNCQKVLAFKYPGVCLVANILALPAIHRRIRRGQKVENYEQWKRILALLSNADVFAGGWPCQDVSVAGQRTGLAGERSGLWFVLRRIIALFRPPWFIGENVPGLLSSRQGRDLRSVTAGLEELGYWWSYRTLDAQFFNVPQRRERVFIVAGPGARSVSQILFESNSLCWDHPPSRQAGQRTAPTLEGRAGRSGANNFATSGDLAATLTKQYASHHGRSADNNGGIAENHLIPMTSNRIAGHHHRQDLDNETYVPVADCARSLRAQSQSSHREDSETYVLAHGQANSEVVSDGEPSLTCNHEAPICFSSKDSGNDAGELSPTLRSMNYDKSHINGGGQVAIAFRAAGQDGFTPSEQTPPIAATDGGGAGAPTVCFGSDTLTLQGIETRIRDGNATETDAKAILRLLQEAHGEEALLHWRTHVLASLHSPEILRQAVHGLRLDAEEPPSEKLNPLRQIQSGAEEAEGAMRKVRKARRTRRSPQGQEHIEQSSIQFGAGLPGLPQQDSQAEEEMLSVWKTAEGIRILRDALSTLQAMGRSDDGEGQSTHSKEKAFGVNRTMQVRRLTPT